ncbi:NACHT, LRR and PYD domains-containing protein 1b allele 2 isoform X2 [Bombina bombina]|uniref:NACHT, LRR and PYD domains-containing protein 1b allele 2 isoform X2 n=1 Tax=Bombina bombina TaxID=8345 RepID=UPI00235AD2A5|nr:NACHT, LRR and PYD domains-containing protein 1b allele 2 isoform X2 [Bombina bombina]
MFLQVEIKSRNWTTSNNYHPDLNLKEHVKIKKEEEEIDIKSLAMKREDECVQLFAEHKTVKKEEETDMKSLAIKSEECENCGQLFAEHKTVKKEEETYMKSLAIKSEEECENCGQLFAEHKTMKKEEETDMKSLAIKSEEECENCGQIPYHGAIMVKPKKRSNSYRLNLKSEGLFCCSETRIQFLVTSPVVIDYALQSWNTYFNDIEKQGYEMAGPLFNIRIGSDPTVVKSVYLPHNLCLKGLDTDLYKNIKVFNLNDAGMTLESPTRIEPYYVELLNPTFSPVGVVVRRLISYLIGRHGRILIFYKCSDGHTFHLFLTPLCDITKQAIEENEKKAHFKNLRKPPQSLTVLYTGKKYIVMGPGEAEIYPEELEFSNFPNEIFSEIHMKMIANDFLLQLLTKEHKELVWCAKVRQGAVGPDHGDILIRHLDNLIEKDHKRFRDKLAEFHFNNIPPIPCGKLEYADSVDTKRLLLVHYGGDALNVAIKVLQQINLKGLAAQIKKEL